MTPNPLEHLTFSEALKIGPLLDRLCEIGQEQIAGLVAFHLPADQAHAAHGLQLVAGDGRLKIVFSKVGQTLLKVGHSRLMRESTDDLIPALMQRGSKALLGTQAAVTAAQLGSAFMRSATVVVSVAHMIVGAHMCKSMEESSDLLDLLVEGRRISQMSRLESIYRFARELLSGHLGEHEKLEVYRLCKELFELRAEWRRTLDLRLQELEREPHTGYWKLWFPERRRNYREAENAGLISQGEAEIHLMDFSLMLHVCLAHVVEKGDVFFENSLPEEVEEMRRVERLLEKKAELIREDSSTREVSVEPVLNRYAQMVKRYRFFCEPLPVLEIQEEENIVLRTFLTDVSGNDTTETSTV